MEFYIVAQDSQDSPVVIGPLSEIASDTLYEEFEELGYTVLSGSARKLSPSQARWEASR